MKTKSVHFGLKTLIVAGAIFTSVNTSYAQDGFYFNPTIGADIVASDVSLKNGSDDVMQDRYSSGKFAVGARVHDNLGFELSYAKSGSETKNTATTSAKTDFNVWGLDVLAYSPKFKEKLEFFGSAGLVRYDYTVEGPGGSASDDDLGLSVGAGAQYLFNEDWAARLAYKHSFVDISDSGSKIVDGVNEISLGVRYTF
jgi:opacity protein-like surface antigen